MKTLLCLVAVVAFATAFVLPPQKDSYLSCTLCQIAVNVSVDPVDKEVQEIEKEFDAECQKELSGVPFLVKECENYANSKLDPIIKELESGTAPEDVCKKIGEC